MITPIETTTLDLTFGPKDLSQFLPAYSQIPNEFKNMSNHWHKFISGWFYDGLKEYPTPKEGIERGIERGIALGHIKTVLSSWEPKHEHKIAGCAYLASLWFKE